MPGSLVVLILRHRCWVTFRQDDSQDVQNAMRKEDRPILTASEREALLKTVEALIVQMASYEFLLNLGEGLPSLLLHGRPHQKIHVRQDVCRMAKRYSPEERNQLSHGRAAVKKVGKTDV